MDLTKVEGVIACMRVEDQPIASPEQTNCEKEKCEACESIIWVSEKKRFVRSKNENLVTLCMYCAVITMKELEKTEGTDSIGMLDLSKIKS